MVAVARCFADPADPAAVADHVTSDKDGENSAAAGS